MLNVREIHFGMLDGKWKSEDLVKASLKMIAENDQDGRKLNSICEIDKNVLFYARALDREFKQSGPRSQLHGIPVVVKDNIDVKGLRTTANSYALSDNIAKEDAFLVKQLRKAGAIILGKANLSEFAYWMSRQGMPSGFGSMNGQVVHARVPGFDPSGSSSGSAVAVAAGFVPLAVGTETDGSLMSPSISNAIVSIKPTVGLVSRNGILPISHYQDTAGPMARTVGDCALLLGAMAGVDENDPATYDQVSMDYLSFCKKDLNGVRVGLLKAKDVEFKEEYRKYYEDLKRMIKAYDGDYEEIELEQGRVNETEILMHEFKCTLNQYLSDHDCKCRNLEDIIEFNRKHSERCLKHGQDLLEASEAKGGFLKESEYLKGRLELSEYCEKTINGLLKKHDVDCLISVHGLRKTNLAPVAGYPCMVIPCVVSGAEKYNPISYYLIGKKYGEGVLIKVAYSLEKQLNLDLEVDWNK